MSDVYARMEKPMSNDPRDPNPHVPEAEVQGWRPLLDGPFPTVDEAMTACEDNEQRMEARA